MCLYFSTCTIVWRISYKDKSFQVNESVLIDLFIVTPLMTQLIIQVISMEGNIVNIFCKLGPILIKCLQIGGMVDTSIIGDNNTVFENINNK